MFLTERRKPGPHVGDPFFRIQSRVWTGRRIGQFVSARFACLIERGVNPLAAALAAGQGECNALQPGGEPARTPAR